MEAHHGQVLNIASPEMYLSYHLHFGGLCSQRKLLPGCFSAFLSFSFFFFLIPFLFFRKKKKASFILQRQLNYRHPLSVHLSHRRCQRQLHLGNSFSLKGLQPAPSLWPGRHIADGFDTISCSVLLLLHPTRTSQAQGTGCSHCVSTSAAGFPLLPSFSSFHLFLPDL